MKKRALSLILCGVMGAALLAGCGSSSSTSSSSSGTSEASASSDTAAAGETAAAAGETEAAAADTGAAAQAIQERKDSGNYPTVVIAFMNFAGSPKGIDRISQQMSAITEEKLGIDVELQIMDSASYSQNMNLMLASGEQVDLFDCVSVGFMPCVNKGYLYDLEEDDLLQTYGADILNTFTETEINGCRVNGTLYGIPVKKDDAGGRFGISIAKQYLDGIGYDYASMEHSDDDDQIIHTDAATITDIFTQLHEKYPDKTVFYNDKGTLVSQCMTVDPVGGDNFGVLLDPANSLEVSDLFTSDYYKEIVGQFYDWNQAGFISKDALTETTATTVQVKAGSLMAYKTATKPGIKQQETNLCGEEVIIFQIGEDFKPSSAYNTMPWAINSQTEDPVAAMQVLNLLYTDPDLSTLICWGQEGVEWKETDDGHITYADGIDADTSEYFNNVNWEMPNQFIAKVWEGNSLDIWTRMQEYNDNALASKAIGFTWDNSDVSSEYTALTNVYEEYRDQIELGFVDPDTAIPEMEERLKAAGLDDYIQAKSDALSAWAQENGVE